MNKLRDVFLRVPVAIDQLAIAFRFLNRIEILTLDVFDQRDFGRGRIVDLANDRGNRVKPGALRSTPATLAGDNLKAVPVRSKQDWLKYAALSDRIGELVDRLFLELNAWLFRIRPNSPDLDLPDTTRTRGSLLACRYGGRRSLFPEKRLKTAS